MKRRHSKIHKLSRNLSYILLNLCYFPVLAKHLQRKWWHKRKGKIKATHISFSIQFLLTYQQAESLRELVESVCISCWIKTTEVILCRVFSVPERMKSICKCKLWNINCIILVNSHVNSMFLYLHLNLTLHIIKMNRKFTKN